MKKIVLPIIITCFIVFGIYNFFNEDKVNYIALGDSLALGENPYGEIGYSYADYLKDYIASKDKLKVYTKNYAKSGDKTTDLIKKIKNNKKVKIANKKISIKRALRESDIVTISIGANDLMRKINMDDIEDLDNINYDSIEENIEDVVENVEKVIIEVKKYAKKEIILVGYYNPISKNLLNDEKIDDLIKKIDNLYTKLCAKHKITYIKVSDDFKNNDYLPNPLNIHPNYKGYQVIADNIIDYLEKNNKKLD